MQTLGDYLKKEREARDISLSEVSDCTKISKIYLDCLEKDEFSKIPGETYVKGYISSYAECLGINEREALQLYDSFQIATYNGEEAEPEIPKAKTSFFFSTKKTWLVITFCLLTLLVSGAYYSFFRNQNNAEDDKRLNEPNHTINSTLTSKMESNIPPKRQAGNSFHSMNNNDSNVKLENREIEKKHDNDIPHKPIALESRRSEQKSKDDELYPPIDELSKVKGPPGPETDQPKSENTLKVIEVSACRNIKNRIPQGFGDAFKWSIERIYVWTRIQCENPPTSIRHIYYFKGEKVNDIILNIRSSHWRTWSYKTLANKRYIGPWRVDIASVGGKVLESINFEIN
jgi:cytoskeletal protein RodZ